MLLESCLDVRVKSWEFFLGLSRIIVNRLIDGWLGVIEIVTHETGV